MDQTRIPFFGVACLTPRLLRASLIAKAWDAVVVAAAEDEDERVNQRITPDWGKEMEEGEVSSKGGSPVTLCGTFHRAKRREEEKKVGARATELEAGSAKERKRTRAREGKKKSVAVAVGAN